MSNSANERQVAGNHYRTEHGLQHWDLVHMFGWDYFQGQITKYLMRWKKKNGIEDLKKARHFLDKYIELHEQGVEAQVQANIKTSLEEDKKEESRLKTILRIPEDLPNTNETYIQDGHGWAEPPADEN